MCLRCVPNASVRYQQRYQILRARIIWILFSFILISFVFLVRRAIIVLKYESFLNCIIYRNHENNNNNNKLSLFAFIFLILLIDSERDDPFYYKSAFSPWKSHCSPNDQIFTRHVMYYGTYTYYCWCRTENSNKRLDIHWLLVAVDIYIDTVSRLSGCWHIFSFLKTYFIR